MAIVSIGGGHRLESVTARQFKLMNWAFHQRFGVDIKVTWSTRDSSQQIALLNKYYRRTSRNTGKWWDGSYWEKKPGKTTTVATPGTSRHERGYALDVRSFEYSYNATMAAWARTNASLYGFSFNVGGEPWHIDPVLTMRITSGNQRALGTAGNTSPGQSSGGSTPSKPPVPAMPSYVTIGKDDDMPVKTKTAGSDEQWFHSGGFSRHIPNGYYLDLIDRTFFGKDGGPLNTAQQRWLADFLNGVPKLNMPK